MFEGTQCKRSDNAKRGEHFLFRSQMEPQIRESALRQEQLARSKDLGEELQGNSDRSQPTETKDDAEARNDFFDGDFIHRHHVEFRVQLYVQKEETFPIPLKYIDVIRTTHTNLDAALTTTGLSMWIEVCQVHGQDSQSSYS